LRYNINFGGVFLFVRAATDSCQRCVQVVRQEERGQDKGGGHRASDEAAWTQHQTRLAGEDRTHDRRRR